MEKELALILDFGGQYNQLIARRVRDKNVYCEILPYSASIERIKSLNPKGIIFTGGPNSVYEEGSPMVDKEIFNLGVPILGICYGMQMMTQMLGGKVSTAQNKEFGKTKTTIVKSGNIFENTDKTQDTWMSHIDYVEILPEGFEITATTDNCPVAAMQDVKRKFYGVQFHAEVEHTQFGETILENFLNICNSLQVQCYI